MSLIEFWPFFGLRITTPRLELRYPTDADLVDLVTVAQHGVHDESTMPFTTPWTDKPSPRFEREAMQHFWRSRSDFSPRQWDLLFAVVFEGEVVGVQNLNASDFPRMRTIETGSWLGQSHQRLGIGTEMRRAVLQFAFEQLDAVQVTSSAFTDNIGSQKVSIAAGYEENGTAIAPRRDGRGELIRYRITRERWNETRIEGISVTGFEPCADLFAPSESDGDQPGPAQSS